MVADDNLLAECIVEVLSRNFPERNILRMKTVHDLDQSELDETQLVLLYRPDATDVLHIIDRFEDRETSASVGIVVESLDVAEALLRSLPENDVIDGIVPLDMRLDVFLATIQLLVKGGEHFPSALLQRLRKSNEPGTMRELANGQRPPQTPNFAKLPTGAMALTTREVQILDLLCMGAQNKIIADRLRVSENTVKVHIRNIYKKMHVRNRTEAASRFFDMDRKGGNN
ncbi:LuxR C-terminal-related transcriptional regulator [Rhizobium helianthi]|uniref:LuxR C-terminal-related transcriptional regulator n=1 Tax=Rhizobium helianthi TaxID=1132695 RepID=A0ABW4M3F9_9HYPH